MDILAGIFYIFSVISILMLLFNIWANTSISAEIPLIIFFVGFFCIFFFSKGERLEMPVPSKYVKVVEYVSESQESILIYSPILRASFTTKDENEIGLVRKGKYRIYLKQDINFYAPDSPPKLFIKE